MGFIINSYRHAGEVIIHTTFDGTNEYVNCGSSIDFDYNDIFSFSGWVYVDAYNKVVISKLSSPQSRGFRFQVNSSGKLAFLLANTLSPATNTLIVETTPTLSLGQWYNVGFSYDGSTNNSGVIFYIDGSSVAKDSPIANSLSSTTINTSDVLIGAQNSVSPAKFFDGKQDKLILYNDVVTAGEFSTIYNYGRKAGLIGIGNEVSQWEMDALNPSDEIGSNDGTSANMDSNNIEVG